MKRTLLFSIMVALGFAAVLASAWAAAPESNVVEREKIYSVLDPRGNNPPVERVALAKRPASLEGKTIYVLSEEQFDHMIPWIVEGLKEQLPKTKVEMRLCSVTNCGSLSEYNKGKDVVEKNADVVIHGPVH